MDSYVVSRTVHGIHVNYLTIGRSGANWHRDLDKAHRFDTAAGATTYLLSTEYYDMTYEIVTVPRVATSQDIWRPYVHRTTTPPIPERPYVPLEPWHMTTGQRVAMTALVVFATVMVLALVNGW